MSSENTIKITDEVKVDVAVGYSKFIKLYKNKNWITLAEKCWRSLVENKDQITAAIDSANTEFELSFTATKAVKRSLYLNLAYVTFTETYEKNGGIMTSYIHLNRIEWEQLVKATTEVDRRLAQDIAYCNYNDNWCLIEAQAIGLCPDNKMKKQLVPRMADADLNMLLYAYVITNAINTLVRNTCQGCIFGYGSQKDHFGGCLEDWELCVAMHYEDGKKAKHLESLIKLNKAMGWDISPRREYDDDKLKAKVLNPEVVVLLDSGINLPKVYWNLFAYLNL